MLCIDIMNVKVIHACSEFIKTISRYFGRNFWKLKVKEQPVILVFAAKKTIEKAKSGISEAGGIQCSEEL